MDTAILTALIQGQMSLIKAERDAESVARQVVTGAGVRSIIQELFPGVGDELLRSCGDVVNHLGQGVGRYVQAMTRGQLNWAWEGQGTAPTTGEPNVWLNAQGSTLRQTLVTDGLVTGKMAVFPAVVDGRLSVTALSGYLRPIFAAGDDSQVVALVQVLHRVQANGVRFEVRRYSPGLLEQWTDLDDWTGFATLRPREFPQRHAADRLPVALRIVNRDADREPVGLVQTALPAMRRYVKAAVLLGFIAHRGGFEERVAYSDMLVRLLKDTPNHPMLRELRKVSVNQIRVVGSGDKYDRLPPVPLKEYRDAERDAMADVRDAMNMPDTGGADLSGEALAEKREAYTETADGLAGSIGEVFTEVHELAAGLQPGQFRAGWRVSLTPRFSRDVDAARLAIREDFKTGGLPQSAFLSELQTLGVTSITDAMVEAAQRLEGEAAPIETTA